LAPLRRAGTRKGPLRIRKREKREKRGAAYFEFWGRNAKRKRKEKPSVLGRSVPRRAPKTLALSPKRDVNGQVTKQRLEPI